MSQQLTRQAQKVIEFATEAARELNHDYVGTEHILLGLIQEGSKCVADVLKSFGVDVSTARGEIEKLVQRGPKPVTRRILPLTPRAKRALEHAATDTPYMNEKYVHPEHLLLGLVEERDGVAGQVLRNLGVVPEELRAEVFRIRLAKSKIVERAVRQVRASLRRKRKMREELLAHLAAIYDQEQARRHDPKAALEAAAQRFGDPAELSRELEMALPSHERINYFVERFLLYRAPESAAHFCLRMAAHTLVLLALAVGLVTFGVFLGHGWTDDVQMLARVSAALVLFTPTAQIVVWLAYIKIRDAMWGAFGSRKSFARVLMYDVLIGFVAAILLMAIATFARWDFAASLETIPLCSVVCPILGLASLLLARFSGPTEIRDTLWALLDLEIA